jgi:redox-sensitive bicupin YhaK (pirin superfamily)
MRMKALLILCLVNISTLMIGVEMSPKQVATIFSATDVHMVGDGFRVFNYFPGVKTDFSSTSPFVLLDYNAPYHFPATTHQKGVGPHPHRGFETVTIVYEGKLAHRDSFGGSGQIKQGEVQWMTAGSGLLHEEYQEKEFSEKGGILHAVQLWVNLPAKDKMTAPKYQTLTSIKTVPLDEQGSCVRVIAGQFGDAKGSASTFTPIELYDVRLKKGAKVTLNLPKTHNSMLLVTGGSLDINQSKKAIFKDLVLFTHEGEEVNLTALEDSMVLVLSGEPINEPVVQMGPFVMNTQEEIGQAQRDYKSGKFGEL